MHACVHVVCAHAYVYTHVKEIIFKSVMTVIEIVWWWWW